MSIKLILPAYYSIALGKGKKTIENVKAMGIVCNLPIVKINANKNKLFNRAMTCFEAWLHKMLDGKSRVWQIVWKMQ